MLIKTHSPANKSAMNPHINNQVIKSLDEDLFPRVRDKLLYDDEWVGLCSWVGEGELLGSGLKNLLNFFSPHFFPQRRLNLDSSRSFWFPGWNHFCFIPAYSWAFRLSIGIKQKCFHPRNQKDLEESRWVSRKTLLIKKWEESHLLMNVATKNKFFGH
jgi:hypothetical protein